METNDAEPDEEPAAGEGPVADRLPPEWRYTPDEENEERYAVAVRENYHEYGHGGGKKTVVLARLKNGDWRVGASTVAFSERRQIDRATRPVGAFVETVQLEETIRILLDEYPRDERRGWLALAKARLDALEGVDPHPDERPTGDGDGERAHPEERRKFLDVSIEGDTTAADLIGNLR